MKRFAACILALSLFIITHAQTYNLTFTACDSNNHYLQLHHVLVINQTQEWSHVIYWPDTTLTMCVGTGIGDIETQDVESLQLFPNNPNPFHGTTTVSLYVPEPGVVNMDVMDITGRVVGTQHNTLLQSGLHQFHVTLSASGVFFMTACCNDRMSIVKMVNLSNGGKNAIEYNGYTETDQAKFIQKSSTKDSITFPFSIGDQMRFVGYAMVNGIMYRSIPLDQAVITSQSYTLQCVVPKNGIDGQPCPEIPFLMDYDSNVYNTVWIGSQCWMRENLRTTHYADGSVIPSGPSTSTITAYRYAPNGNEDNVSIFGYLYNWPAVMHGESSSTVNPSGVQGICPEGWHVPSNLEWKILTNYVSSQNQFVCGYDSTYIAKSLADTIGWDLSTGECCVGNNPLTNNSTGFSALPAGYFYQGYQAFGSYADFWDATDYSNYIADGRYIGYNNPMVGDNNAFKDAGCSVRCVRNPSEY